MSTKSGLFQASSGYSQQAGSYYLTISSIAEQFLTHTPGTGSGGSATVGTFTNFTYTLNTQSTVLMAANRVIKDMGKSIVSAGRTFRKFQAVAPQYVSSSGVTGDAGSNTNPGYLTGYLEVADEGNSSNTALIVRYA